MKIEFIEDPSDKNTNNFKEYYPFVFQNNIWKVDRKWFAITHPNIQKVFELLEHPIELSDFTFPHEFVTRQVLFGFTI